MNEFATRIGRVRMKDGGADVHVIRNRKMEAGGEDWRGTLAANARSVAEHHTEQCPLVGYIMLGVFKDGAYSIGYRWNSNTAPIPQTLLPTYVAEVIRRELVTATEARQVFNEMFEWVE